MQPSYNPLVSVVIPVRNGALTLDACLRSLRRSYYRNFEIVVVDDHSTDGTADVARRNGSVLVEAVGGAGANHARNLGAMHAKGEVLAFVDADIIVTRETLLGIVESLEDPGTDAVVGLYTAKHRHESLVSQYKNLWVRYSYLKSPPGIDWLFGSISGIKRKAFEQLGGFDIQLMVQYGDEIELGKRMAQANLNIVLNMDLEVEHLKKYNLWTFIQNEFRRSLGFAELASRFGETAKSVHRGFINVYPSFVISTVFSVVLLAVASLALLGYGADWVLWSTAGVYFLLNIRFLNFLEQVRGLFAMFFMIPFLFIDHVVCFAGSMTGLFLGFLRRGKQVPP